MSEVAALEKQYADAKALIERRDIAIKLYSNPDFKKIVLDGFCLHDCARYAQESQDPALTPAQQADALNIAQAAGHFRRYMSIVVQLGNHAENQLASIDEVLQELRMDTGEG